METKELNLATSIDVESTIADLQPWDAQGKILENTGICRDGGVTNLYNIVESNTMYEEVFFTRNGGRVRLVRDDVNQFFRVFSNDREVGQVPQWGVCCRRVISVDANDVLYTVENSYLLLRIATGVAKIEEYDIETDTLLRARSFAVPADVSDAFFVRSIAPTYTNTASIAVVYAVGTTLNHAIVTEGGAVYTPTGQVGFTDASQVFAFYRNGWIIASNDPKDPRAYLFNSSGVQQGTYTESTFIVANQVGGAVTFTGWRDVTTGTPGTYGYRFTPPAAPGGSWAITALTAAITTPTSVSMTFGGIAIAYGSPLSIFYANNATTRTWTVGHKTLPEIYGSLDQGSPVPIKVHTVAGQGAYLSGSYNVDGIGANISEVGELNGNYYPQILTDSDGLVNIIFRRGDGSYGFTRLSDGHGFSRLQEVSSGVVKVNTVSATNIVNTNNNTMLWGGNAFNGFVIVGFDAVSPVQKAFVARFRGEYGGSVDTGYKSTATVTVGAVTLLVIPEGVPYTPTNEMIDVYVGPPPASLEYYRSIRDGVSQSTKGFLQGTIYVDDSIIPPPMGAVYSEQTIQLIGTTAIKEQGYDGYALLNEAQGAYQSFNLYGQLYLFDGDQIYSALLNVNTLQRLTPVAKALGLSFLCVSPQLAYFYSTFDNSVYTFSGGQSVDKSIMLNQRGTVYMGEYNVRENTLALFLDESILFLRDGVLSEVPLPITYPYTSFSSSDGIWVAQNSYAIKYVYRGTDTTVIVSLILDGGEWGTVYTDTIDGGAWGTSYATTYDSATWESGNSVTVPLTLQTKYNGFSDRVKQSVDRFMFRVYKQDRTELVVTVNYYGYHESGLVTESTDITVTDYDANGYAMFEYIPRSKNSIASSIKLTFPSKVVLLDGYAEVTSMAKTVARDRG